MGHYARILEVPFVKFRPDVSLEELVKLQNADTIFIDTFGIAPRDHEKLERLQKMLNFNDVELTERLEIHLTIPVGIQANDIKTLLESFALLSPNYLLFTKWDETENWGGMLSAILQSKKAVSLITHGQDVPDDIALFSSQSFIQTVTAFETSREN